MAKRKTYDEVKNDSNYRTELVLKVKGCKEWIECEGYEGCYILDEDLPKGKYSYYCRHSESNLSLIVGVKKEKGLTVNFWGTIVTDEPLEFGDGRFNDELEITRMVDDTYNHDAIMVFGSTAANAYLTGGFKAMQRAIDNGDGQLVYRVFCSKGERNAYLQGLDDMLGWESCTLITAADVCQHFKTINEMTKEAA